MIARWPVWAACAGVTFGLLCLPAAPLHSQAQSPLDEPAAIIRTITAGTAYADQHQLFLPPFAAWTNAGLPPAVLAETLTEGIARRAGSAQIVAALQARAARAPQLRSILPAAQEFPSPAQYASWVRMVETGLRAGIDATALSNFLSHGTTRRTAQAIVVTVDLTQTGGLTAAQATRIAAALLGSHIPETRFESVLPLVVRNRSRLGAEELVTTISAVLTGGGGIVQIEAELSARRR